MTKRSAIALWLPSWSKLTILPWVSHFFNLSHDKTHNLMVYSEIPFWNEMFLCSIKKDCCWIVTDSPHVKAENRKQCTMPSARDFATVLSDSPGQGDFAIGLVLNLPDGQVLFFGGNSNYRRIVINPANQKGFLGLIEMTCWLVHASYSLPEWQAVKLTFFAPYHL